MAGEVSCAERDDTEGDHKEEDDDKLKVSRIIAFVDLAMKNYLERIRALKKSREKAEADALSRERRGQVDGATISSPEEPEAVKPRSVKEIQENFLINEILEKYALERETQERLTNSLFEMIVEVTKKEHQMEIDMPLRKLKDIVRSRYDEKVAKEEESGTGFRKNYTQLLEEVYRRYAQAMEVHGGRLPAEQLNDIVGNVQREYGIIGANTVNLKMRCRKRFAKENPGFTLAAGGDGGAGLRPTAESDKGEGRRRRLLDEIAARFVQEGGAHPELVQDGTLDCIIQQAEEDLGITEFDVPKESVMAIVHRQNFHAHDEDP